MVNCLKLNIQQNGLRCPALPFGKAPQATSPDGWYIQWLFFWPRSHRHLCLKQSGERFPEHRLRTHKIVPNLLSRNKAKRWPDVLNATRAHGAARCAQLCLTLHSPWTIAHPAPLSMEFSRQEEYWSRLLLPTPRDLPDPGIKFTSLESPVLAGRFFTTSAAWEVSAARKGLQICAQTEPFRRDAKHKLELTQRCQKWGRQLSPRSKNSGYHWSAHLTSFYFHRNGIRLERGRVLLHLFCTHTIVIKHQGAFKIWKPCRGFLLPTLS